MGSWIPFFAAVCAAVITGILGNRLVQSWQQRNWHRQQQFLGYEKEYQELKSTSDEIARSCGERLVCMQDLLAGLQRGNADEELKRYRLAITDWNRNLHSFYARLTYQIGWDFTWNLERRIHNEFRHSGVKLEAQVRVVLAGSMPSRASIAECQKSLNALTGEIDSFLRKLVRETEQRRQETYYGRKLKYRLADIRLFSNFELLKLLFVSDIDGYSVVRPTFDLPSPLGRGL